MNDRCQARFLPAAPLLLLCGLLSGLLLALWPRAALAQAAPRLPFALAEPAFERIDPDQAISGGTVTALLQDQRGLLWIGSQHGLIRYDGYRFQSFVHDARQSGSLPGNFVVSLAQAPRPPQARPGTGLPTKPGTNQATKQADNLAADQDAGQIWVGLDNDGLARFDPRTGQFASFRHQPNQPHSISPGTIWAMLAEADGGLWLATDGGLDYRPPGDTRFFHLRHAKGNPASLASDQVRSLLLDRQGNLWVGSYGGLQRLGSAERARWIQSLGLAAAPAAAAAAAAATAPAPATTNGPKFATLALPPAMVGQVITSVFQAQDGKLWIGSNKQGAAWHDPASGRWQHLPPPDASGHANDQRFRLSHSWVVAISQINPGQIWLATALGGITVVASDDGRVLQRLRHDAALPSSLALDDIGALLHDRSGWLWIGTWGGGLQRYHANHQPFSILRHSPSRPAGLSHADVRSVLELADGKILIGTSGNGIDIYDRQQGVIGGYRAKSSPANPAAPGTSPPRPTLPDAAVYALAQTDDGTLWAGTVQAGVVRLPPDQASAPLWQTTSGWPNQKINRLLAVGNTVWAGTDNGLARWQGERFEVVPGPDGQSIGSVVALVIDAAGWLWVGSNRGLWFLEPGASRLSAIGHDPKRADSLISNVVKGLLLDKQGRLWVNTHQGLEKMLPFDATALDGKPDGKAARFEHISAKLGLQGQNLGGNLHQDGKGRLWVGYALIDPVALTMVDLSKLDGYDNGGSWSGASGQTRDGYLLVGGATGLAIIDSAAFVPWQDQPPVVVTELKIDGKSAPLGQLVGSAPRLTLNPGQRHFSIEFAALDYASPRQNRYRYQLQGIDREWIDTDYEHRLAGYGNLWPGQYQLRVRGSNRFGAWSGNELVVAINILPAFWQTGWFLALMLLLSGSAIWLGYRWRLAKLQRRTEQLEAVVALRTADISRAHNQLAESHRELQEAQAQLVESGKMATLGQLLANVAHEINTPLGAVQGSSKVIADGYANSLDAVPRLYQILTPPQLLLFRSLLTHAIAGDDATSTRQLREQSHALQQQLEQAGVAGAARKASALAHLRVYPVLHADLARYLPLLAHEQADFILKSAQAMALIHSHTRNIDQALARMSKIVYALTSFLPTSQAGQLSGVDLDQSIDTVLTIYQTRMQQGIQLVQQYQPLPAVPGYPDQLNQVWNHLIQNALQAMQYQGTLTIRIGQAGANAMVAISDTGCGMEPAVQARIFEPFFTTRPSGEGSGLGLDLVRKIVARHHGRITVESQPGQGSTFTVFLPLRSEPA